MTAVEFSPDEIDLCDQLKGAGLPWHPAPGHFVWDPQQLIERPSPFHDRVYFILDLKHFLRRTGTLQRLIETMVWLPTWEQGRRLLRDQGVPDSQVSTNLVDAKALSRGTERLVLYQQLLLRLR